MRLLGVVALCAFAVGTAGAASSSSAVARCRPGQLALTGSLQGATQSLLGTLTVANTTGRACALPVAPSKALLRVGTKLLPTVTVRMSTAMEPLGLPVRKVGAHQRVFVGIQWRNWCGSPKGKVRLSVGLKIFAASPRVAAHKTRTPVCASRKSASRVAVSRFKSSPP
ncbi:MAG TPA: DUF4232 domain-containing protein [Gaiellaceae bacterium]|jgi:hypothetical protein